MKHIFLLTFLLFLSTGCFKQASYSLHSRSISKDAMARVAQAATAVSQSLHDLKAIEKMVNLPLNNKFLPYPTSYSLTKLVSIDWSGPIQPLLERIANMAHYKLRVIGRTPALPVLVTLTARNMPLGYIIRDADWQAGTKAGVFVYPAIKTIELRYVPI